MNKVILDTNRVELKLGDDVAFYANRVLNTGYIYKVDMNYPSGPKVNITMNPKSEKPEPHSYKIFDGSILSSSNEWYINYNIVKLK